MDIPKLLPTPNLKGAKSVGELVVENGRRAAISRFMPFPNHNLLGTLFFKPDIFKFQDVALRFKLQVSALNQKRAMV
ncbi:hypothetical protein AXF42_Ash013353 [Apostasia shenzhenica]|uniref:Uncharacterized protein n=1 Tax=Apostasia shenzhenica TaxID=1088818 RepID=A0A2I0BBR5_9ASPA|nr:hypothetical protein AXF42_Ash013353 [Apostasia shenzhenica]